MTQIDADAGGSGELERQPTDREKSYALEKIIEWFTEAEPTQVAGYVGKLREQNPGISDDDLARKIVSRRSLKNGMVGAATGLGGVLTLPVALPGNLIATWKIQVFTICCVAHAYGHTRATADLKTDIYIVMAGEGAKQPLKRFGIEASTAVTKKVVDKYITREVMKKLWGVLGRKIITKAGQKSLTSFTRMVPLVGAPVGFLFDWSMARTVGHFAIKYYSGRG